jgi:hypothetical protein
MWGTRKKGQSKKAECRICSSRGRKGASEIYEVTGEAGTSMFDVAKAKEIVGDGRAPHVLPRNLLRSVPEQHQFEEAHLAHVKASVPGILGKYRGGIVLIDGMHRAIRCLREGKEFRAYFLDEEECLSCVVSQDLWETNAGTIAAKLRELLRNHPERDVEVQLRCPPSFVAQIRKLLTPEQNARVKIRLREGKVKHSE